MTNLDLFKQTECDHLPLSQRYFDGDWLICSRCGKVLRHKDMTK